MSFLSPVWLAFGLLAIPILLLYMLKLRRREVLVSSVFLWSTLLRDRQANTPWQRLKRNLLLLLQLLILFAMVFAMARPAIPAPGLPSESVVILLDASASMNATDVQPSRFAAAREAASHLVAGLKDGARITLILAGSDPRILATGEGDKASFYKSLENAKPENGAPDWEAAFAITAGAASSALEGGSEDVTTVIVSDGGLPEGLPPLPGEVRYLHVGQVAENLGITAMALRPSPAGPQLFAQVKNFGDSPGQAVLSFYAGDALFGARQVELPAGEETNVVISDLPQDQTVYRASLSTLNNDPLDDLELDDTAYAIYQPSAAGRTLLVSKGNFFLEQLLAALPGLTPYRALVSGSDDLPAPSEKFDLYILDGLFPNELPVGNLLLINPPPNPLFPVGEMVSLPPEAHVIEDPLTQFVDWRPVHIASARSIDTPPWANVLVESGSTPLVFAGEVQGRRIAVLAFDLHDSDLPLQVAYPILFSNLIDYLIPKSPLDAPSALSPGDSLRISPVSKNNTAKIFSPSGKTYELSLEENAVTFSNTDELGLYEVRFSGQGANEEEPDQDHALFAVNLFQPGESDLHPADSIEIGRSEVSPSEEGLAGQRELWPVLVSLALLLLLVEWLIYQQRGGRPGMWKWLIFWRSNRANAGHAGMGR